MTYQSLSPFDGKLIKGFDDLNAVDYEAKIAAESAKRDEKRLRLRATREETDGSLAQERPVLDDDREHRAERVLESE